MMFPLLRSIFLFCWLTCYVCHNSGLNFNYTSERPSLITPSEVALSTNHITSFTLGYFIIFYFLVLFEIILFGYLFTSGVSIEMLIDVKWLMQMQCELVFSGCKTVGNWNLSNPQRACILGKGQWWLLLIIQESSRNCQFQRSQKLTDDYFFLKIKHCMDQTKH